MGIFGIRLYQNEGSFNLNLNSNLFPKSLSKAGSTNIPKSDQKNLALFEKLERNMNSLESIQELKIPKLNLDNVSISKESDVLVLSIPF